MRFVLILLAMAGACFAQAPCLPADAPVDPAVTNPVAFRYEFPLTNRAAIRLIHEATAGVTYEVQYKTNLADSNWFAYTHIVAPATQPIMTDHPMNCGDVARFFRVMRN